MKTTLLLLCLTSLCHAQTPAKPATPEATTKGIPQIKVVANEGGGNATPVKVTLTLDKNHYTKGERPIIKAKPEQDCKLQLFYQDAEGNTAQLFPNIELKDNSAKAGKEITLMPTPRPGSTTEHVVLEVAGPPYGKEFFILIATKETPDLLAAANTKGIGDTAFPPATTKAGTVISQLKAVTNPTDTALGCVKITVQISDKK